MVRPEESFLEVYREPSPAGYAETLTPTAPAVLHSSELPAYFRGALRVSGRDFFRSPAVTALIFCPHARTCCSPRCPRCVGPECPSWLSRHADRGGHRRRQWRFERPSHPVAPAGRRPK